MTDDYLSKDREHIAGRQRQRRARMARIDYYPSPEALVLIESRRTRYGPTNNNSGIIDMIIAEWAVLAGLRQSEIDKPKSPATSPGAAEHYARMRLSSESRTSTQADASPVAPELSDTSRARARANDFGSHPAENKANQARVICSAKRRRDGQPCQGLSVSGKRRCRWHGGTSTGPRTDEGRARSMANLRQYQNRKPERDKPCGLVSGLQSASERLSTAPHPP